MPFVDEVIFKVKAGDGGNGSVSFHREKFRPKMGPDGGDGGKGGDVVAQYDPQVRDLYPIARRKILRAENGKPGGKNRKHGKAGKDLTIHLPEYCSVFSLPDHRLLGVVSSRNPSLVIARGGKGGRGNSHFSSAGRRMPTYAEPGRKGEEVLIKIQWSYPADVGILGERQVGKTSILSRITGIQIPSNPTQQFFPFVWKPSGEKRLRMVDLPPVCPEESTCPDFLHHLFFCRLLLIVEADQPQHPIPRFLSLWQKKKKLWEEFLRTCVPASGKARHIWVVNKIDMRSTFEWKDLRHPDLVPVSASDGFGLSTLSQLILDSFPEYWGER